MDEHEVATPRLVLRRWRRDDLDPLAAVFARPEVWWYPLQRGRTFEETRLFLERQLAERDERGWSLWAAVHRGDDRLIGFVGLARPTFLPEIMLAVEVGWRLDPAYWGRGLATEGGQAALDFGFEVLGLERIVSICEPENVASLRVMERLGMTLDRRATHPTHGVPLLVHELTRDRWRARGTSRVGRDAGSTGG